MSIWIQISLDSILENEENRLKVVGSDARKLMFNIICQ